MKDKKVPMRKCVGCMTSMEKEKLVRIAAYEGKLTVDLTGRAKGRGVYVCKNNPDCIRKAYTRKALERALSVGISKEDKDALFEELKKIGV